MTGDDWRGGLAGHAAGTPRPRRRTSEPARRPLIPGWQDGAIPTPEQLATLSAWQGLAAEVLTACSGLAGPYQGAVRASRLALDDRRAARPLVHP